MTYEYNMEIPGKVHWKVTFIEEFNAIECNISLTQATLPSVPFTYHVKWCSSGSLMNEDTEHEIKPVWLQKGCAQLHEVDYDESFAPTVSLDVLLLCI